MSGAASFRSFSASAGIFARVPPFTGSIMTMGLLCLTAIS